MADEYSWMDLSDANLPPSSRQPSSGWSISNLVNIICSLNHMAEENLITMGTKHFNDTLAKNDILYRNKRRYIPGQIVHIRKSYSVKRPAHHITLPPFPLKRRWSELALPTFMMASTKGNKPQEEDTNNKQNPGSRDDIAFKSICKDLDVNETVSERTHNIIFCVKPPQRGDYDYEGGKDIILELPSSQDHPLEAPIASDRNSRRRWNGVRRQISHLFSLCHCLPVPRRRNTTFR
ncbi:uncharacterized protein LOC132648647 [Meriones unguiculatus]|uniref:uncharacterized protein LOC132648647 n=1 Tax=Meriones unguiculatus TaxID=10047 RepID=UPI00293F53EB|nr:uncharacterized protein LOC132648647 [Meriones unguiculatus]